MNGCKNVHAVRMAVSGVAESRSFVISTLVDRGYLGSASTAGFVQVETTTLDEYFAQKDGSIDLVKMDIEGSELSALAGMRKLAARTPKFSLIMEFNLAQMRRAGYGSNELTTAIRSLGFRQGLVIEKGLRPIPLNRPQPGSRLVFNMLFTDRASGSRTSDHAK